MDARTHAGIYSPLAEDTVTESKGAAMGGVVAMLAYFRTGQYYLNLGGTYRDFFPEVLRGAPHCRWSATTTPCAAPAGSQLRCTGS